MARKKAARKTADDGCRHVVLKGALTVESAEDIKKSLTQALQGGGAVRVRFGDVTSADLALLQILCAASVTAARENVALTLDDDQLPEAVARALDDAGFASHCGCPGGRCLWPGRSAQCGREGMDA